MKKNVLLILFLPLLLNGCSSLKRLKTVTQGNTVQRDYIEEIPFEFIDNQIILQVEINDNFYPFIFDTGNDLTSIDLSLLDQIDYKSNNVNYTISDASNIARTNEYLSINKLSIGGIEFKNIGAQTTDFSHFKQVNACNHYVGIIGSNLMRKAKWEIDYQNKILKITDNIENFIIPEDAITFKTNSGNYGSADIKISINEIEGKFTFDTGYSGFIHAGMELFDRINATKKINYKKRTGINSMNAHGFTTSTIYKSRIEKIEVGNIKLSAQIVDFEDNRSKLLGNAFFKHFLITLDWENEIIYLQKRINFEKPEINTYQLIFYPNYSTNKIETYAYWSDYDLETPIELNSTFLSLNGIDVSNFETSELCDFWYNKKSNFMTSTINAKILDNGEIKQIQLNRKELLP